MPIEIACSCGKRFRVADEFAGRAGKCPGCGAAFSVPVPRTLEGMGERQSTATGEADDAGTFDLAEPVIEPARGGGSGGGLRRLDEASDDGPKGKGRTCTGCGAPIAERALICTACGRSTLTGRMVETQTGEDDDGEKRGFFLLRPVIEVAGTGYSPLVLLLLLGLVVGPIAYYMTGPGKAVHVYHAAPVHVIAAMDRGETREPYSLFTGTGDRSLGVKGSNTASNQQRNVTSGGDLLTYSVGGNEELLVLRENEDGEAILLDVGLRQSKVSASGATSGYDSVIKAGDFELVPAEGQHGGKAIPARLLRTSFLTSEAYLDLGGAKTSKVTAPLPPPEPTRYTEQAEGATVSAVAVFNGQTEGTVRVTGSRSYQGMPPGDGVFAEGELNTSHPRDTAFTVQHQYNFDELVVDWADGDEGRWAVSSYKQHSDMSPWYRYKFGLLFQPESGTPEGKYDLVYCGQPISTVHLEAPRSASANVASNSSNAAGSGKPPPVSPIKTQQGVPSNRQINPNNPLSYFDILLEARDRAEGLVSASNIRQIGLALLTYTQDTGDFPESFEDLKAHVPGFEQLLINPRTGENPGFIYEKPPPGAPPSLTPVVWEAWQGQKDPTGAVLYGDGSVR